jgi:hypothetical protein
MKRVLVLTFGIVLLGTCAAQAWTTADDGYFHGVCTPISGGRTQLDVFLVKTGLYPTGDVAVNGIEGTFSLTEPDAKFYLTGNSGQWKDKTRSIYMTSAGNPQAAINFLTANTSSTWTRIAATSGTDAYVSLKGGWYTSKPDPQTTDPDLRLRVPDLLTPEPGFDRTLLATFYIDGAVGLHYAGKIGFGYADGTALTQNIEFTLTGVPEPSVVIMLLGALAMVGAAYLRRR